MGILVSSSHFFSLLLLSPYREDSSHFPCSSVKVPPMGVSSPQIYPTWVLPTGCNSSQTAPAWVLPTGCSPSGTGCSSLGPPWGSQVLPANLLHCGLLSLHGSIGPGRSLLQHRLPTGSQLLSGIHLLRRGVPLAAVGSLIHHRPPWTAVGQPTLPWSSSRAAGKNSLLRHLEHLLPAPSSLTLVSAELFLSHGLTPLSWLRFHYRFFPFLTVIPEALAPSLLAWP